MPPWPDWTGVTAPAWLTDHAYAPSVPVQEKVGALWLVKLAGPAVIVGAAGTVESTVKLYRKDVVALPAAS